jgi:type IV secretion system protein VirD4
MYVIMRRILLLTILLVGYLAGLVMYLVPYAWLGVVILAIVILCKRKYSYSAYGTARWAVASDIPSMLDGNGLIVGHIAGKLGKFDGIKALFDSRLPAKQACLKFLNSCQRKQPKQLVRLTKAVHTAIFAPTGVGKGVSCVIPFLLTCRDSCVVVDFKGENARLTAQTRRKMGHRVVIVDPFRVVTQNPDTFNPLHFIDEESHTALDDCHDLAEALVIRTGDERDPHWTDSAEVWITAMMALVVCFGNEEEKSLQFARDLLTNPEKMQAAIKKMCDSDMWEGMLSRMGYQLTQFVERELGSVLTTTNRFLRFLDTLAIAESTKSSSFNPADLLKGKMTVYLVLPPEHMRAQSALLRLWIGSMLRAVVKNGLQEKNKVHFVLDEAASLGHMDALDDAIDKYRGYGVRLQLYYQSLGQLKKCWGTNGGDQVVMSNTSQVFFGVNDQQTAEYVSARLGEETIIVTSGGKGTSVTTQPSKEGGASTSTSRSTNDNWSQLGRRLLKPEEVTSLNERVAITFIPSAPPIWTWLIRWYESGWDDSGGIGPVKAVVDTACLFIAASVLAVWFTAALYYSGTFQ